MSIKTIEEPYEIPAVPARVAVKKKYECESCKAQFDSAGDAQRHFASKHSYVAVRSLAGHLGDAESLPTEIRGEEMFKFETQEGFEAFYGEGSRREWSGPGWYVKSTGFSKCGRCSASYCGHNWTSLTSLESYERSLTQYMQNVHERLRSARATLGPRCPECEQCGTHGTGCIEETIKDEEELRKVLVHDGSGCERQEILDGRCVRCGSAPETTETVLVPWTQVQA